MSRRAQWYVVAGVLVGLSGLLLVASERWRVPEPVDVGSRAADFQARTVDPPAHIKHLSDYRNRVVLLNIWATWCIPCQREMPTIERLFQELGPRGLTVVAVSIDDAGSDRDIGEFAREYGLTFEILHDPTGQVQQSYQLVGVPESFLIDRDGVIRKRAFESDWYSPENRALVAKLLGSN